MLVLLAIAVLVISFKLLVALTKLWAKLALFVIIVLMALVLFFLII